MQRGKGVPKNRPISLCTNAQPYNPAYPYILTRYYNYCTA
jgi:hypothetical protein